MCTVYTEITVRDCYSIITEPLRRTTDSCLHAIFNYMYNEPLGLTLVIDGTVCRCGTSLCNGDNITSDATVIPRRHMSATSYRPFNTATARWITSPSRSSVWQAPTSRPHVIGLPTLTNKPDSPRTTPSIYITNTQMSSNNSNRANQSTSQRTHQSVETSSAKTQRASVVAILSAVIYMRARYH